MELNGVFAPATTPFDPVTGDVDVVSLRANVRRWLAEPLRGIVLFGSTGEGVLLDEAEKARLTAATRDLVDADRLLLCGTGAESTRATRCTGKPPRVSCRARPVSASITNSCCVPVRVDDTTTWRESGAHAGSSLRPSLVSRRTDRSRTLMECTWNSPPTRDWNATRRPSGDQSGLAR